MQPHPSITVISGCAVATVDPLGTEYPTGHLVVQGGRILAIGADIVDPVCALVFRHPFAVELLLIDGAPIVEHEQPVHADIADPAQRSGAASATWPSAPAALDRADQLRRRGGNRQLLPQRPQTGRVRPRIGS